MKWTKGEYTVTDKREDLDIDTIHGFLRESYWAKGIPKSIVEKAVNHSLCFGLYHTCGQIGFGRAITDCATLAYLADIFVLAPYRGRGLGRWLVACMLSHPQLQGLRRWMLATEDAHGLYARNGFLALQKPDRFMEINDPDIYQRKA
jgi:N-acetylglutamate synthase-like GNAT family acetyltransferase